MLILIFWHTVDTFLSSTYAREFWSSPSVSLAGLALASVSRALLINLPIDRWQEAIRLWCNDVRQSSMHATQFKSSHVGSTHFWCWQRRPTHTTLMIPSRKKTGYEILGVKFERKLGNWTSPAVRMQHEKKRGRWSIWVLGFLLIFMASTNNHLSSWVSSQVSSG